MTDLDPYSGTETPCPMCRGVRVTTEYRKARGPVGYAGGEARPEHLSRCCERCGYRWREAVPDGEASTR